MALRARLICLLLLALVGAFPGAALAAKSPVCAACGTTIGPGRYLMDQWNAAYHVQHSNIRRCVYCARGISDYNTGGGVRYGDGREVCNICQHSAVLDEQTAAQIAREVRTRLERWGLTFDYGEIPVRLADRPTLEAVYGQSHERHSGSLQGVTAKKWMKDPSGQVVSREVTIYMLDGLPRPVFDKTMAHEMMHAWMFLDQEPEHSPSLEEGTCNLASYYLLQEDRSFFAKLMREALFRASDPVYGEGLRRAIRYVQRHEFAGLVDLLRAERDFPKGD